MPVMNRTLVLAGKATCRVEVVTSAVMRRLPLFSLLMYPMYLSVRRECALEREAISVITC